MEADWSAEIAPGLPEIIVPWSAENLESAENPAEDDGEILAWRDLRLADPQLQAAIQSIPCAAQEPALAAALRALHQPESPWLTSKCDLWTNTPDDLEAPDPYEFDAAELAPAPLYLCVSYLDILAREAAPFASFAAHEALLNAVVAKLRAQSQPHARVDFVLRAARAHDIDGFAFSAYAAGCGISAADAHSAWQQALARVIAALPG